MLDRRNVRIQFRRLRVPDAVPRAGHAARTPRTAVPRPRLRRSTRHSPRRLTCRALDALARSFRRPHRPGRRRSDARSLRGRTGRAHLAGGAGAGGRVRTRGVPARRRRQRRPQHLQRSADVRDARRRGRAPTTDADSLADRSRALAVDAEGLVADSERCTTRKLRVVTTRNQQVARVDYERDHGDCRLESSSGSSTGSPSWPPRADAIVVSDYLKGAITRGRRRRLRRGRDGIEAFRSSSIRRCRTSTTTRARRW